MLDNDGDVDSMIILCNQMNMDHVDIQVKDIVSDNDSMDIDDNDIYSGDWSL